MSDFNLAEFMDELGEAFGEFKEAQSESLDNLKAENDSLCERVEEIERERATSGTIGKRKATTRLYRKFRTKSGDQAYEVKGRDRFSDIPELRGQSDVGLDRVLGALVLGSDCGDDEAVRAANEMKSVGTGTSGITLENTVATDFIDRVRAQSILFAAGARSVSMPTQSMSYIHQTGDPTISWRASEGAGLTASEPAFAARTLTAKTAATRVQISLEAAQDVTDAGRQIADGITAALAVDIDRVAFAGASASNEPVGIQNTTGRGQVTSVGAPTNWDEVLDGVQTFLNANNALSDLTGICMHPNVWRVYQGLKTGITSDNTPLSLPPALEGISQFISTGCDIVASPEDYHVTLGNFGDALVGFRMNPSVRILDDTTSYASNLLIEIVGVMRVDFVALRPASFVCLEGVTTS